MNRFSPLIALGGVFVGSLAVAVLGYFVMAGVTLPEPALAAVAFSQAVPTVVAPVEVVLEGTPQAQVEIVNLEDTVVEAEVSGAEVRQEMDVVAEEECAVSASFPDGVRQWCGIITHYANKRGLPPNLVAALILQESGGNAGIYSHSGAVGLMQVMPNDGIASGFMCANGPCFSQRPSSSELEDPEFNVAYGTRMLSRLVKKYGDVREALRSYGPMDVGYHYADTVLAIFNRYGE